MTVDTEKLIAFRHDLHANPEVGLHLPRTQQKVLDALDGLGLEFTLGDRSTSVMAVLRGGDVNRTQPKRPTVLLRADMDGLPVVEDTGLDWASTNGHMHACGHDTHTAMLVATAQALAESRSSLQGDVVFMFQPGEEGVDGAQVMIDEGVIDVAGQVPDAAMGIHVWSNAAHGVFSLRRGKMMASGGSLIVTMKGVGGHGSAPHQAKDPIPALLESVLALQVGITREFDAFQPIVFTVGSIHAGTRRNVIPSEGTFEATVRTFDDVTRDKFAQFAPRVVRGIADAYGLDVDICLEDGYPSLQNDPREVEFGIDLIQDLFGEDHLTFLANPMGGTEDFSRVLQRIPGYFVFLGACAPDADPLSAPSNHSGQAYFDDAVLQRGVGLETTWARRRLQSIALQRE
jgi:hippurate hydrolase